MKMLLNSILLLFSYIKIGTALLVGRYEILPFAMQKELCEKGKWMTPGEVNEVYIASSLSPGNRTINSIYLSGLKIAGYAGSILASAGLLFLPLVSVALIEWIDRLETGSEALHLFYLCIRAVFVGMTFFGIFRPDIIRVEGKIDRVVLGCIFLSIVFFWEMSALLLILIGFFDLMFFCIYNLDYRRGIVFMTGLLIFFGVCGIIPFMVFSITAILSFLTYVFNNCGDGE